MYLCFPCFYCCLYKHNEEYTTNVYKHWRDEFEAKKIDFSIYYSPGSLWDAFMEDDFQLAPSTHCFCIDTSSSYVRGVYQTHADVNSGTILTITVVGIKYQIDRVTMIISNKYSSILAIFFYESNYSN